jgi:hypothetical protein
MPEYDMKLDVNFWADRNFRIKAKNAMDAEEKLLSMVKEYYSADLEEDFEKAITNNGYWSFGDIAFDVVYFERVDDKSEELEISAYEKGFLMSRAFQLRDESYESLSKGDDDWHTVHVDSRVFSLNVWEDGEGVTRVTAYQDHLGENGYQTDGLKFKRLL